MTWTYRRISPDRIAAKPLITAHHQRLAGVLLYVDSRLHLALQ
jgi:hypothetical protein